jgi:4-alpha-glucanotransferase
MRLFLFAQWLASAQLTALGARARERCIGLYLDLPLGCHQDGFDTWRFRDIFGRGAACGAPSDPGFPGGQNWGLPPIVPSRQRASQYDYFIRVIRHQLDFATMLRLDHVMGLHRLFWIPDGMNASDGVYVRYPAKEMYAIVCLESARRQAVIVGENLGTVPGYVNQAMRRHGLYELYVLQYALLGGASVLKPPLHSVASLNTHDMVPFAGFLAGRDIDLRLQAGLVDAGFAASERQQREPLRRDLTAVLSREGLLRAGDAGAPELHRAAVEHLRRGGPRYLLINLEDCWGETEPQNLPGTASVPPNWSRRSALSLAELDGIEFG